jgi:hypothetical protein
VVTVAYDHRLVKAIKCGGSGGVTSLSSAETRTSKTTKQVLCLFYQAAFPKLPTFIKRKEIKLSLTKLFISTEIWCVFQHTYVNMVILM